MESKVYSDDMLEVAFRFKKDEGFMPDSLPLTFANTIVMHGGHVNNYAVDEDGKRLLGARVPEYLYEMLKESLMGSYMEETIDDAKYLFVTL